MRNHPGRWGGYGHPFLGLLIMAAVVVGIVLLVVWLVRRNDHRHGLAPATAPMGRPDSALEHARVRYARGELTREQYVQIVTDLGGLPPGPAGPPGPPEAPPASG